MQGVKEPGVHASNCLGDSGAGREGRAQQQQNLSSDTDSTMQTQGTLCSRLWPQPQGCSLLSPKRRVSVFQPTFMSREFQQWNSAGKHLVPHMTTHASSSTVFHIMPAVNSFPYHAMSRLSMTPATCKSSTTLCHPSCPWGASAGGAVNVDE